MWKPVLILAAIMLAVGIATCSINRHVVHTSKEDRPLDWIGDDLPCQKCPTGVVKALSGYWYRCDTCKVEYRARRSSDGGHEIDWEE